MINDEIRDKELRVISSDGEQLGIMSREEAMSLAESKGMDLVNISPTANPPVCKILNYGKYRYELQKKEKEAKKKQTTTQMKEIRLSTYIEDHDIQVKANTAYKFLKAGDKVKVNLRFRGREATYAARGVEVMGYRKYLPATVAEDVSDKTVMVIEEMSESLPGVTVESETRRYYPNGKTASHILGYMGKISDSSKDAFIAKGYEASAIIGLSGIEGSFESVLHGINGYYKVQVNAQGERVKEISKTEPVKGKDIYLTIDLQLQKTAESALKRGLRSIRTGAVFKSKYGDVTPNKVAPNAEVGAVVALDVETGDVLAMCSHGH